MSVCLASLTASRVYLSEAASGRIKAATPVLPINLHKGKDKETSLSIQAEVNGTLVVSWSANTAQIVLHPLAGINSHKDVDNVDGKDVSTSTFGVNSGGRKQKRHSKSFGNPDQYRLAWWDYTGSPDRCPTLRSSSIVRTGCCVGTSFESSCNSLQSRAESVLRTVPLSKVVPQLELSGMHC